MDGELPRVSEEPAEGVDGSQAAGRLVPYRELMVGCGRSRDKRLGLPDRSGWHSLTTLDMHPEVGPDVVWDLNVLPLPFPDNEFDEIHAYDVLEHCGRQGDWKFFFEQFSDFWRLMRPGGFLFATTPAHGSVMTWADPGHTRSISKASLVFLSQAAYTQFARTNMTDYRSIYHADFEVVQAADVDEQLRFVLRAIK